MTMELVRRGQPLAPKPYHYTQCGLEDVYLLNGYRQHKTAYGDGVSIEDVEGLHKAIALNLVRNKALLNGREIKFLRNLMDYTQSDLARRLRCNVQTVARWEKGQTEISGPSDLCVRLFYLANTVKSPDISMLAQELADELADMNIGGSPPQYFKETPEGWRAAA